MANVINAKPIFCDTAATLYLAEKSVNLKAIAWLNDQASGCDIAADDDMLLSDGNGNRIIGKRAVFAGDGIEMYHFPENFACDGLVMTTLDGGVCYIFID